MIVALDFETSGLDPKVHAPVSLGVALMDGPTVIEKQSWVIAPPTKNGKILREYNVAALEVSAHTWGEIKRGSSPSEVCRQLKTWVANNDAATLLVVAFNAPFDYSFYSELLFMAGTWNHHKKAFEFFPPPLSGPWQCVRMMAMNMQPLDSTSLDSYAQHYGFARSEGKHDALEDAILAGQIYNQLAQADTSKVVTP